VVAFDAAGESSLDHGVDPAHGAVAELDSTRELPMLSERWTLDAG